MCHLACWCVTMSYPETKGLVEVDSSTILDLFGLIGLCRVLGLCHSFKGCALPPSLPFHYCLYYCGLEVSFEIKCESLKSPTLFFFEIVLGILGALNFHMNFRISLSIAAKKPAEILVGLVLNR